MSTKKKVLSVSADDCILQTFRSGGKGGQHQNTSNSGARYIHPPSGARGESREERSQWQNRKTAWRRMVESKEFQLWLRRTLGQELALYAEATRYLSPIPAHDLKIEVKRDGRWTEIQEKDLAL